MAKWLGVLAIVLMIGVMATPAMAQETGGDDAAASAGSGDIGKGLGYVGAGLVVLGIGIGIGRIGGSATESIARQPEFKADIQTAMILAAALIEGAGLFGLILIGFI